MEQSEPINALRFLSIDAVQKANSGHPGMPMGMAEIATALWKNHLNGYNLQEKIWSIVMYIQWHERVFGD